MTSLNVHDLKHKELTEKIIQAFYKIYNTLGYGFLEKIYINALLMELTRMGLRALREAAIHVYYDGTIVGDYFSDIIVEDLIIIEVKAAKHLPPDHEAQLLNYLKATKIEVGLLLNFGPKPEVKRRMFRNR